MGSLGIPIPQLEHAIRQVCLSLEQDSSHAPFWEAMAEDDLWRELVACILGSRVRFSAAQAAVERMDRDDLFSATRRSLSRNDYEHDVMRALAGTPSESPGALGLHGQYPFARLRANQIRTAAEAIYANGKTLRCLLADTSNAREMRRRLATEVAGLGPKQASLFLRNVGYAINVAILDVHVLTYMNWIGLTPVLADSVRTLRQYEVLEDLLIEHSCSAGFPPSRFDVAVWVVVRVAKREFASCH